MECQTGLMRKNIAMRRKPGRKPGRNRNPGTNPGRNPGKILMPGEIQVGMILGRNSKFNCLPCFFIEIKGLSQINCVQAEQDLKNS